MFHFHAITSSHLTLKQSLPSLACYPCCIVWTVLILWIEWLLFLQVIIEYLLLLLKCLFHKIMGVILTSVIRLGISLDGRLAIPLLFGTEVVHVRRRPKLNNIIVLLNFVDRWPRKTIIWNANAWSQIFYLLKNLQRYPEN